MNLNLNKITFNLEVSMVRWIAKMALNKLREFLKGIDEKQTKELAAKINKKVNIPGISEDAEERLIYAALDNALKISIELLDAAK